ncbi:hypothetical protein LINPERPRIM_LOCUS9791 [Linum perenne]
MVLSLHMECIQIVCEWHLTFSLVSSAFSNLLQLGLGTTVKLCRRRKESLHESMCGLVQKAGVGAIWPPVESPLAVALCHECELRPDSMYALSEDSYSFLLVILSCISLSSASSAMHSRSLDLADMVFDSSLRQFSRMEAARVRSPCSAAVLASHIASAAFNLLRCLSTSIDTNSWPATSGLSS